MATFGTHPHKKFIIILDIGRLTGSDYNKKIKLLFPCPPAPIATGIFNIIKVETI
jgi:hypothetical protein